MTSSKAALVFFGVAGVLVVTLALGGVVAYRAYALRDFNSWDEKGPPPIAGALYSAQGSRVTELMMTTVPGTKLTDVADMSIFGAARPGISPSEFAKRYGGPVLHTGHAAVEASFEIDSSPLLPDIEAFVLRATPAPRLLVDRFFHPMVAEKIRRANLSGPYTSITESRRGS